MNQMQIIATHHAPDLDAIAAVWLLKSFDAQHYAEAKVAFVDPGSTLTLEAAEELGYQLHEVTHVDTGEGEFDHHSAQQAKLKICAASLVHDYLLKIHPELAQDSALKKLVDFVTEVDHFGEVAWPDANTTRYCFMLHELIRGHESVALHDDESQLHFGMQCLDYAYAALVQTVRAQEIIEQKATKFDLTFGSCLAVETRNSNVIKEAQKQGFALVVTKDSQRGNINIKMRPDVPVTLEALDQEVRQSDPRGTWYYHQSGKMLINGSRKHRNQVPSRLSLAKVIELLQRLYPVPVAK